MRAFRTGGVVVPAGLTAQILAISVTGAAGVGLAVAGVDSPVRAALVLLFLAVAPTAAIAGLLRTGDRLGRLIIAGTANIAILALTAMIMVAEGIWSPAGGLLVVTAITVGCLVARLPQVRSQASALARSWRGTRPARVPARAPARDTTIRPGQAAAGQSAGAYPISHVTVLPEGTATPSDGARREPGSLPD